MSVPLVTLNDGVEIPQLGFGTMDVFPKRVDSAESHEATARVVGEAIRAGYRHLDTAQMYVNERGVGLAIARCEVPRDQLFVTSKLGNGNHRPDDVRRSFDATLENLGVDQLDLFLMHWPTPTLYDGDYVSTWRAMTDLVDEGRLRSAGVSNFKPHHLARIVEATGRVPVINQIEVHPYFQNRLTVDACRRYGIAVEAWSPLSKAAVLDASVIVRIADAHGRTPAQVVLRWHTQRGRVIIPKSTNPERMRQNLASLRFDLPEADLLALDGLDLGDPGRRGADPDTFDWIPRAPSRPSEPSTSVTDAPTGSRQ